MAEGDFGTSENVTVQVIPMTVSQFLNEKLTPIPDALNDADLDPAEAGELIKGTIEHTLCDLNACIV